MTINPIQKEELNNLLTLGFNDAGRRIEGKFTVVHLSFLERVWRSVQEFFGYKEHIHKDREEMCAFYQRAKLNIQQLSADLEDPAKLNETIPAIKTMLKVHAKIANSLWGKNMRVLEDYSYKRLLKPILGKKSPIPEDCAYKKFGSEIKDLQAAAQQNIQANNWANTPEQKQIARWMTAKLSQRRFAAFRDLDIVPYQFHEIPAGAVMLTNPKFHIIGSVFLKDKRRSIGSFLNLAKGLICQWKTGHMYSHAELSLGNAESFDLDKREDSSIHGQIKIQQRKGEGVFYGDIVMPKEQVMLDAHNAKFPNDRCEQFSDLWSKIAEQARGPGLYATASPMDIIRVALFSEKRAENYDCSNDWAPGKKQYGCSATVAALFSHFGIDLGAALNKVTRNISPADYRRSPFFQDLFIG